MLAVCVCACMCLDMVDAQACAAVLCDSWYGFMGGRCLYTWCVYMNCLLSVVPYK